MFKLAAIHREVPMASFIRSSHLTLVSLTLSTALCACTTSSSPATDSGVPGDTGAAKDTGTSKDSGEIKDSGTIKDASESDASDAAVAVQGPGASLLCASSGKNAFETYGATGFVAVNQAIFANVTAELGPDAGDAGSGLGPTFGAVGTGTLGDASVPALSDPIASFEGRLAAYLVFAFGGPTSIKYTDGKTYSGLIDLVAAHTGLQITPDQYTYFVTTDVVPALTSSGVSTADVSSCFAPLVLSTPFMQQIVANGASAGSDLKCGSGKNAFDTYGTAAFVAVNKSIFSNVGTQLGTEAGAVGLGPVFTEVGTGAEAGVPALDDNGATFEGKLAAFLVYSFGGPSQITYTDNKTYSGLQMMTTAHTGLGITSDEYSYFVSNVVVPALTSNGVPTADVTACFAPVVLDPNFEAQIVGQ
jgi:hypothetical protein